MRFLHLKLEEIVIFIILAIGINGPIVLMEYRKDLHKVHFTGLSIEEALGTARMENKSIFLEIRKRMCLPCMRIRNHTYVRKEIGTFYNEYFISISMDNSSSEAGRWITSDRINNYPLLLIIDPSGNAVVSAQGYLSTKELLQFGLSGLDKMDTN